MTEESAKQMTWHKNGKRYNPDKMVHTSDGEAWKHFDMKSKFEWRVNGFDRMGQAGVHSIGMGVLIGLEEWRTDVTMICLLYTSPDGSPYRVGEMCVTPQ